MKRINGEAKIFFLKKRVIFPSNSSYLYIEKSPFSKEINIGENILFSPIKGIRSIINKTGKFASLCNVIEKHELTSHLKLKIICKEKAIVSQIKNLQYATYSSKIEKISPTNPIVHQLKRKSQELIFLININESDKLIDLINFTINPMQIMDFICDHFITRFPHRYKIYNCNNIELRAQYILKNITDIVSKIDKTVEKI